MRGHLKEVKKSLESEYHRIGSDTRDIYERIVKKLREYSGDKYFSEDELKDIALNKLARYVFTNLKAMEFEDVPERIKRHVMLTAYHNGTKEGESLEEHFRKNWESTLENIADNVMDKSGLEIE